MRFNSTWIRKPNVEAGAAYSGTLTGTARGSSLNFFKVTGPSWLTVAADGSLSGTPSSGDVGSNIFKVMVGNESGASDTMTLIVVVEAMEPSEPMKKN